VGDGGLRAVGSSRGAQSALTPNSCLSADVQDSRTRLAKLAETDSQKDTTAGESGLLQARTAKINAGRGKSGQAEFLLTFDGSSTPDSAEFKSGDASLQQVKEALLRAEYPVSFPDLSSLKIVRRGTLTCQATGCQMIFKPLEPISLTSATR